MSALITASARFFKRLVRLYSVQRIQSLQFNLGGRNHSVRFPCVDTRLFTTKLPFCAIRIWANSGIRNGSDCWVRYGSNNSGQNAGTNDDKDKDCNYLGSGDYSPEKAGVGGSTPSLATKSHTFNSLPLILNPIHRVDIS